MILNIITFIFFVNFCFSSYVQSPITTLNKITNSKSLSFGGINEYSELKKKSYQFSYSNSFNNIFEEGLITINNQNKSFYLSYFRIPDIDNTTMAWVDNGDGFPSSDEINYQNINKLHYSEIYLISPFFLGYTDFKFWPSLSYSSIFNEFSYSASLAASRKVNFKKFNFNFVIHDIISVKWWSTNRIENYYPSLEISMVSLFDKVKVLTKSVLNKNKIIGAFGFSYEVNDRLVFRNGIDPNKDYSFGFGIKNNFLTMDLAFIPQSVNPFKPSQQITIIFIPQ